MRPLSLDLRLRIVAAVDEGESVSRVASRYRVARQTIYDLLRAHEQGNLAPTRHPGNPTPKKLDAPAIAALRRWLKEKNDLTLKQMQARLLKECRVTVSRKSIWRRLKALNLAWKKNGSRRRTTTGGCQAEA